MAEERLIDDDKDRKYRIRKNENGEEELVIIEDTEEEGIPGFGVVTDEDNVLTEEQLVERREAMLRKAEQLKNDAREMLLRDDFESAQSALSQASELTEYDGELYYLQLKACSRNMTDFTELQKCVDAAEGVRENSTEEQKSELLSICEPLKDRINEFSEKCEKLGEENERGKAERRGTFKNAKKRSLAVFICTAVPFAALLILAIYFASIMFTSPDGLYIILTVVFTVLAVVALFATIFTFSRFNTAYRRVKLNEMNSATKVGREFDLCREELENLNKIYSSFKNDIS